MPPYLDTEIGAFTIRNGLPLVCDSRNKLLLEEPESITL